MKNALLKLQIESLEQQFKVLKSKIIPKKEKKSLSDLYGVFEGKMDLSLEEIKKEGYSFLQQKEERT